MAKYMDALGNWNAKKMTLYDSELSSKAVISLITGLVSTLLYA
jgi:hypothetical protein